MDFRKDVLVRSTATVSRNKWKYDADVLYELDAELPLVPVLPAELNQVILNLIVNAADAIREKHAKDETHRGEIVLRTYQDGLFAVIEVADNGAGIPREARQRVFDAFFTTKEVGKGTGQGLAISHDIIVNKHRGDIDVQTETGEGTKFCVRLPLQGAQISSTDQQEEPVESNADNPETVPV
ncbi:sensor histidine kinase [Aeoliella mucimassa]|uniref:histidine kinase n=1 Tax=Aeoliella mucimassa TaxID=2527972 RepID=A0A518AR26_9BACT|nr:ATP-binding protein [Aeoliella mucimassa]QDU57170.1 Sensor histidine kinase RcsC [Aeoliella mucimassa]